MPGCRYVYCRLQTPDTWERCPRCAFPVDSELAKTREAALAALPEARPGAMADMHQILPMLPGNLELQIEIMDALGVDWALLQSVPDEAATLAGNETLRLVRDSYPGRYEISQFVDPRAEDALEKLDAAAEVKAAAIKLLPCMGWAPDDARFDAFFARMEAHGQLAMVHTGFITARHKDEERAAGQFFNSRFGRPIYFDIVARKFPRLQILLCHLGGAEWYEEGCRMVSEHDNVWGDFSGPGIGALRRIVQTGAELDWDKVFWGNDAPAFAYGYNLRLQLGLMREGGLDWAIPRVFNDNARAFAARHWKR